MKELNIDILKKYADLGFLTDTSIINACELQPELLKTINVYDYISVTDLGNIDAVESSPIEVDLNSIDKVTPNVPIEVDLNSIDKVTPNVPIEVEPTTAEVDDVKEPETIEEVEPIAEPVAPEIPEIVVEEKEVKIEPVKSTKTKKN
jgi:hypothetical protein